MEIPKFISALRRKLVRQPTRPTFDRIQPVTFYDFLTPAEQAAVDEEIRGTASATSGGVILRPEDCSRLSADRKTSVKRQMGKLLG